MHNPSVSFGFESVRTRTGERKQERTDPDEVLGRLSERRPSRALFADRACRKTTSAPATQKRTSTR